MSDSENVDQLELPPTLQLTELSREVRRRFDRDPIPENFCYVEEDGFTHDIRIDVLFDGSLVERRFPAAVLESSIAGASILLPADLPSETLLRVLGVEKQSGRVYFRAGFQIVTKQKWLLLPTDKRIVESRRQSMIGKLEERFRGDLIHRYGLQFVPSVREDCSALNELYRAYLQSLYMEHVMNSRAQSAERADRDAFLAGFRLPLPSTLLEQSGLDRAEHPHLAKESRD